MGDEYTQFGEEVAKNLDLGQFSPKPGESETETFYRIYGNVVIAGCKAASIVLTGGLASFLCNPEVLKDAGQELLGALLPDSWVAHGIPDICTVPGQLWVGRNNNYPILTTWKAAVATVQTIWDTGRKVLNFPEAPYKVRNKLLIPRDPKFQAYPYLVKKNKEDVAKGLAKPKMYLPPSEGYTNSAEDALYHWLWNCTFGWNPELQPGYRVLPDGYSVVGRTCLNAYAGDAKVMTGQYAGPIEDAMQWPGAYDKIHCGVGPFGISMLGNWQGKLEDEPEYASNELARCITQIWADQLKPLQYALGEVAAGTVLQLQRDAAAGEHAPAEPSTLAKVAKAGAVTAGIGAVGYGVYRALLWAKLLT